MPDNLSLPSLLSILREKQPQSLISSVVNGRSINLISKVLSEEDYTSVAAQLVSREPDVEDILDFVLFLICNDRLSSSDRLRARRLIFAVLKRTPIMPRSLFVTGVFIPDKRDYIAVGGFGRVLKGKLGEKDVALKVLYRTRSDIEFCREALMWRSLTHRFVLPMLGIYEDDEDESASQFFLVSPYMANGTLAEWRKSAHPSTSEIEARMLEVAQGLQYIHSEGVVHGDLRGSNVLLDGNLHAQIADFGLTRISEATVTHTQALSYNFAAPELFGYSEMGISNSDNQVIKTHMSDVYAFGCLYYEIHYGVIPLASRNDYQIMKLVLEGAHLQRRDEPPLSNRAWELIMRCRAMRAAERPVMADVTKYMADTMADTNSLVLKKPKKAFLVKKVLSRGCLFFVLGVLLSILISCYMLANSFRVDCTEPLDIVQDWHIRTFRPKWFGLFGEPAPIVYRTWGFVPYQISVVDIDKRDIEIRMLVDDQDRGYKSVELDPSVDCGDDIPQCLELQFAAALVDVSSGMHKIRAEIRKRNISEPFNWGEERQRRVMWAVKRCRRLKLEHKNQAFWNILSAGIEWFGTLI